MFTTVLTCDPRRPTLDATFVEALRNAWGGRDIRWLSEGIAAEFAMPQRRDPSGLRAGMADIDVNVVRSDTRRKRLLLADMDSTMIEQECIDELAAEAGIGDQVAAITARAMNGEIDFEDALRERVALLRGSPVEAIDRVLAERITYRSGGATLLATMKANGASTVLVSGGFTAFTAKVSEHLGFDHHRANELLMRNGVLTGEAGQPILGKQAKVDELERQATALRIGPEDVIAVGDGANDLAMLHRAELGVALHAKPAVQAAADLVVNHGDLTALLYLQGYRRDDFVVPTGEPGSPTTQPR